MIKSKVLHVTKEILRMSERQNSHHCIVANAIRAAIPGVFSVDVTVDSIRFNYGGLRYYWRNPAPIAKRLIKWDENGEVKPFSFQLQHPLTAEIQKRLPRVGKPNAHPKRAHGDRFIARRRHGLKTLRERYN